MKTRAPIYAAVLIFTTATAVQMRAQDDLDSLKGNLATPAPAAPTPKPTAEASRAPAATPTPRASTSTSTSATKQSATPAAPRGEGIHEQLAHGNFVTERDLAGLAGKKVPANTFLTGTFKGTGQQSGGRREFGDAGLLKGGTKLLIRFPGNQDPRIFQPGYSSRWERSAPLRVESVSSGKDGIIAYCTDIP